MTPRVRTAVAILLAAGIGLAAENVSAVQPDEILKDAKLETRARALSAELRCLVCQNQSIDDSDAPLARDLRLLVRERLMAGDSDDKALQFLVDRYGDFVLLRPRLTTQTYLLWIAPLLIFLAGVFLARRIFRNNMAASLSSPEDLSGEEKRRLHAVLEQNKKSAG